MCFVPMLPNNYLDPDLSPWSPRRVSRVRGSVPSPTPPARPSPTPANFRCQPGCRLCFRPPAMDQRSPQPPPGSIQLLEGLTGLREMLCSRNHQFIIKGGHSGTAGEKRRKGRPGAGKGARAATPVSVSVLSRGTTHRTAPWAHQPRMTDSAIGRWGLTQLPALSPPPR